MKNGNGTDMETYTDVRYSKIYSGLVILLAALFIILAIISFLSKLSLILLIVSIIVFFIGGLILLFAGITLRGRKYFRLDKQNQTVMIFGIIGSLFAREYPYDRIYLEGKELYIEKNSKKKLLGIVQYRCDKEDFSAFIKEITG